MSMKAMSADGSVVIETTCEQRLRLHIQILAHLDDGEELPVSLVKEMLLECLRCC